MTLFRAKLAIILGACNPPLCLKRLRDIIGLADEQDPTRDRQAGDVAHRDPQFSARALRELRREGEHRDNRRPHLIEAL